MKSKHGPLQFNYSEIALALALYGHSQTLCSEVAPPLTLCGLTCGHLELLVCTLFLHGRLPRLRLDWLEPQPFVEL